MKGRLTGASSFVSWCELTGMRSYTQHFTIHSDIGLGKWQILPNSGENVYVGRQLPTHLF